MTVRSDALLFAYFDNGAAPDAEQIRFAVTPDADPTRWAPLNRGLPLLTSTVGELGARDPFILRDEGRGLFVVIATDLRIFPDGDWERAVTFGSRSIVIWESADLVSWSPPRLAEIAPQTAGNAWAPKAYWLSDRSTWRIYFAAAIYDATSTRKVQTHQRILMVDTEDFVTFSPAMTYLDPGHDVIDAAFLEWDGERSRFTADSLTDDPQSKSQFVRQDRGASLDVPEAQTVELQLGRQHQARAEGPAPFVGIDDDFAYLMLDEFELRGYQLYRSTNPHTGDWQRVPGARLPTGARHGSVIRITAAERGRLEGPAPVIRQ
ncbi:MAG: glycoside hydrolase family 43 protein [Leifsonia sp.]